MKSSGTKFEESPIVKKRYGIAEPAIPYRFFTVLYQGAFTVEVVMTWLSYSEPTLAKTVTSA